MNHFFIVLYIYIYIYIYINYDSIWTYNICSMMIALTIKPRHQLIFGVGKIQTQVPYSTTKDFTSWVNWIVFSISIKINSICYLIPNDMHVISQTICMLSQSKLKQDQNRTLCPRNQRSPIPYNRKNNILKNY